MAAQGRDVKLDPARIAGYRNFGTKLWNATRFAEMNDVARNDDFWLNDAKLAVNRWILTELTRAAREITVILASHPPLRGDLRSSGRRDKAGERRIPATGDARGAD